MDLRSLEDTRALARRLIRETEPGALLLLAGPMGAGKTTLMKMLAEELGSDAKVSSPTYTLIHEYPSPAGKLVHVDAYRLPDTAALQQLGLEEYLDHSRLVAVEWGEKLIDLYPHAWLVRLNRTGDSRSAVVHSPGAESEV